MSREQPAAYEYKVTFQPSRQSVRFRFSMKEIEHLAVSAVLVLGVGFSLMLGLPTTQSLFQMGPVVLAIFSAVFVALFLLHEIAHKLVAQHYGLWAEFRLILFGAVLTLISAIPFSPFKIIAPGAMMIAGSADQKIMGKTAVAGPLTNILLALVTLPIVLIFQPAILIVALNAWIALINTLPILMLDGLKIFRWNKIVWGVVFAVALILTLLTFFNL